MSLECVIVNCQRTANVLCHCCKENLCRQHYNEHDYLNSKLNLLADQIETFDRQLVAIDLKNYTQHSSEQIEQWRRHSYQLIDDYCAEKYQEVEDRLMKIVNDQRDKIDQVRKEMLNTVEKRQMTLEKIEQLTTNLELIEKELHGIDEKHLSIRTANLVVEKNLIRIDDLTVRDNFQLSNLPAVSQTIGYTRQGVYHIASSGDFLLVHREPNLCLIDRNFRIQKQIQWKFGQIFDMCWSSALRKYFLITLEEIYILDIDNQMIVKAMENAENLRWFCCTCSNNSLFLTTNERGSSIYEFSLLNSFQRSKYWQAPETCDRREQIQDIIYSKEHLLLIIENDTKGQVRLELRSVKGLQRLWTLPLHVEFQSKVMSCATFHNDQWLVIDGNASRILQITMDGKLKSSCFYNPMPICACLFTDRILAISTIRGVNFHQNL